MWMWRRTERIKRMDRVMNEEMSKRVCEEKQILKVLKTRKRKWFGQRMKRHKARWWMLWKESWKKRKNRRIEEEKRREWRRIEEEDEDTSC